MQFSWEKILAPEEILQKEFTISKRYRLAILISSIVLAIGAIISTASFLIGITILILGVIYWIYLTKAKHYAYTNKRIVLVDSFIGISTISVDYNQITDIELQQSLFEQIGGWGTIIINTAGTRAPEILLSFIENPEVLKQELDAIRDTIHPMPVTIMQESPTHSGEESPTPSKPPESQNS